MPPKTDYQPGSAPSCKEEQEARKELSEQVQELALAIGEAPDPTASPGSREGTGIKGTLSRILGSQERQEAKLDDLIKASKTKTIPPPSKALAQKIGWWIVVILLALQQVPALYAQLQGTAAASPPALTTGKP